MILKRMPVRYRLAYMISLGFVISFGIRCNMGVAVVAMIENRTVLIANSSNGTSFSSVNAPEFHWSPETISVLDSSYFWGYILTQIPGGYLSAKFPAHKVLGFAFGISAFLNALIPLAVKTHVSMAMIVRIFQGLVEGVTYPTCHGIWRYWAPPQERARLTTITFSGSYAGAVLGMPLSGIMTENISWQLSFYIYGILGLLWSYAWFQFSSERPSTSFQIDQDELTYIEESIGTTSSYGDKVWIKPPWIQIVKSLPVWSIIVANFCRSFSFYLLIVGQAFYFKEALGITVGSSGFLAALPHLVMTCVVPLSGYLADYLQTKKDISTTAVRKIMNCGGFGMEAMFLLAVAAAKTTPGAITALTLALGFSGFAISGFNVNHLDIAPRYASLLMGISNSFGTIAGLLSPIVSQLMTRKGTREEWARVFVIASLLHLIGIVFYACFASGTKQPWADYSIGLGEEDYMLDRKYNRDLNQQEESIEIPVFKNPDVLISL